MRVKALGFNQGRAVQAESAHAAVLCGLFENTLLRAFGSGKNPDLSVSQHAINIEKNQFYFARAHLGHAVEYSIASLGGLAGRRFFQSIQSVLEACGTDMHDAIEGMVNIGDCHQHNGNREAQRADLKRMDLEILDAE